MRTKPVTQAGTPAQEPSLYQAQLRRQFHLPYLPHPDLDSGTAAHSTVTLFFWRFDRGCRQTARQKTRAWHDARLRFEAALVVCAAVAIRG